MTPNEALDTLDRVYHTPLAAVVRAELERLREEVMRLKRMEQHGIAGRRALLDEIDVLHQDLAAARADAKRYRWLTDCAGIDFECMAPYQLVGRMSDRIDIMIAAGDKT